MPISWLSIGDERTLRRKGVLEQTPCDRNLAAPPCGKVPWRKLLGEDRGACHLHLLPFAWFIKAVASSKDIKRESLLATITNSWQYSTLARYTTNLGRKNVTGLVQASGQGLQELEAFTNALLRSGFTSNVCVGIGHCKCVQMSYCQHFPPMSAGKFWLPFTFLDIVWTSVWLEVDEFTPTYCSKHRWLHDFND